MNRRILLYLALLFVAVSSFAYAQTATPAAASLQSSSQGWSAQYCSDFFQNKINAVTNAFAGTNGYAGVLGGASPFTHIVSLSLLIVLVVVMVLSVVYGIGVGFGINKLVVFARTEYLESFMNILILLAIITGITAINGAVGFFNALPGISGISQTVPSGGGGSLMYGVYTNICSNIIEHQMVPYLGGMLSLTLQQPLYFALQSLSVSTAFGSQYLPAFTIAPMAGFGIYTQLLLYESSPLLVLVMLGIIVIFLLYTVFFLFPLFLYAGMLLRSFPWTRAAGGSLLALFIAFYIIFPSLYYPFTQVDALIVAPTAGQSCSLYNGTPNSTNAAASTIGQYCTQSSGSVWSTIGEVIGSRLWTWMTALFSLFTGGGNPFIENLGFYIDIISLAALQLFGLGMAFLISFDLLEALGDLLGAPSLQSHRILERMI